MKTKLLSIILVFSTLFLFSQTNNVHSGKRVLIKNPSKAELLLVKEAGIDLACGATFSKGDLILELSQGEIQKLNEKNIFYSILIDDLVSYYKEKTKRELPLAKKQLEQLKAKSKKRNQASKVQITSAESIDNYVQYEGSSEVNWSVPSNFNLGSMAGCLTYSEMLAELDEMRTYSENNGLGIISLKLDASPSSQKTHGNSYTTGGYNSWAGQSIIYVRISDNADSDEVNEPESLYTGMTHSREVSSMMNLIYYMWYLLENYNTDPGIKNLVDNHEMYFIPVANPDGLMWNEEIAPSGGGLQRKNLGPYNTGDNDLRGVDLNRNYNYFWGSSSLYGGSSGVQSNQTYRGPSAASEPEVQIVEDFSAGRNFKTAMNHHATSNLIPHAYNGYPAAPPSGREAEYHKFCHDMTRYNRYIYGEAPDILTIANGDMSDWMLGGVPDVNGATGSGQAILALAPENGAWDGSEGGFWPNSTQIVDIAKRAMRMNFMNAYYSGKFAQFHDLNSDVITTTSGNFEFGLEYLGQTLGDITLNVIPVSNIASITSPITQKSWSKLEQRTLSAAYTLSAGIQTNDKIEFQITLSNDDGYVMYQANIIKYYNPSVLTVNDTGDINNWIVSGGSWGTTTTTNYKGVNTSAITDSPGGSYSNNSNNNIKYGTPVDLSTSTSYIVQYYAKWDLERNFDYVQIEGSTNGTTWIPLTGKYTKPGSDYLTTRYSSTYSTNTSTGKSTSDQNNQPTGEMIYDGDTMDKWVKEEVVIDASNNSSLLGAGSVQFRFLFDSDNTNRADGYPTTFDGFYFDDFTIIKAPCDVTVPTTVSAASIASTTATINWDNAGFPSYDLRYRVNGSSTWTDLAVPTNSLGLTGLASTTEYEVQVRSVCDGNTSSYSSSIIFTTLAVDYCAANGNNTTYEYIGNVTLGAINNTSGVGTTSTGYSDFTALTTDLDRSAAAPSISVTKIWTGTKYNERIKVWIDFNHDGDFLDLGEEVLFTALNQDITETGAIPIPGTATLGVTRMRVIMSDNNTIDSCGLFSYGEVEDYTVNIIDSTLGIEDEILSEFVVYPNPVTKGEVTLRMPNEIVDFTILISNVFGQKVYQKEVISNYNNVHKVPTANLQSGIYFITVSTNLGKATKKLIIQ